jgi:hypothetical protein
MISPAQCRAARGLLDWRQQDLAREAEVGVVTIRQLEAGVIQPRRAWFVAPLKQRASNSSTTMRTAWGCDFGKRDESDLGNEPIHHPIFRSPSSTRVLGFLRPREPAGSKTVRPTLRPVVNAQDLDCRSLKPIGDDVGCPRNDKFARARHPSGAADPWIVRD